jgi:hypothetical protein
MPSKWPLNSGNRSDLIPKECKIPVPKSQSAVNEAALFLEKCSWDIDAVDSDASQMEEAQFEIR